MELIVQLVLFIIQLKAGKTKSSMDHLRKESQ